MKEKVDLQFSGLAPSVNAFSAAGELACAILDNCLLRNKDLIEPFRGYTKSVANPDGTIGRVFPWQSRILAFSTANTLRDYSDGTGWSSVYTQAASNNWGAQTTFSAPDANNPVRAISAAKSFFFTTSAGVKVFDGIGNGVQDVGLPAPSISSLHTSTPGNVSWLQVGWSVAYRAVLGKHDANNNLILSAPSNPISITDADVAAGDVTVGIQLPVNINGATFIQLYRTLQVDSSTTATPGDEMFLVQEQLLSTIAAGSGISAYGALALVDDFSDNNGVGSTLLGQPLYTNPVTGDGIGAANDLPPLARDLVSYNGSLLLANTTDRHSIQLTLIGLGGLILGTSTIIIGGVTYKAAGSNNPTVTPPLFHLVTGLGSVAENINATALNLVMIVNSYNFKNGGNIQATYLSTPDTQPGQMLFSEVGIGGNAFTIAVGQDGQVCWNPDLSLASITLTSQNNGQPSRLWWSATNEPWALPADNWVDIGSPDQPIIKIVLVRSTVFVFKKDGLWTLTGNSAPFTITPFDSGLVLLARETAVVVNNQIYCLTNRGYVYVTESGVSPSLSRAIERDLNFIQYEVAGYPSVAFGVPYESDGLAFLALPTTGTTTSSPQQYVFNAFNPSWSRLFIFSNALHGCFDPARQALCWAAGSSLYEERKSFGATDFQLPSLTGSTVGSTNSNTVVITGATITTGDIVNDGSSNFIVLAVHGTTITIDGTHSYAAGPLTIFKAINCHIRFLPWSGGDPTQLKRFESVYLAFTSGSFETLAVGFNSESSNSFTSTALPGPGVGALAPAVPQYLVRADVPQQVGTCAMLGLDIQIQQAYAFWQLEAVRFAFDVDTPEAVR